MTTMQIVMALANSEAGKREGSPLNIITYLALNSRDRTGTDAIRECLAIWKKLGGSEPRMASDASRPELMPKL